jgi:hypothetical protein
MRTLLAAAFALVFSSTAFASSHREAPFITKNPKVDNTDFYLFNSYETGRTNYVTVISNFQPLQAKYGGPNYFSMDPEALYEIHFDNTGDAVEDITFQFRFQNTLAGGQGVALPIALPDGGSFLAGPDGGVTLIPIPLINAAPLGVDDGGTGFTKPGLLQGQFESYTVGIVRGPRRGAAAQAVTNAVGGGTSFPKPLDNIGPKTFPGNTYEAYARSHIYDVNIPGCGMPAKVFVGQRKEGFAVNLGTIFDLVNAPLSVIADPANRGAVPYDAPGGVNQTNVTTIAMEIHRSCLRQGTETVIGGWSTASLRQARVLNPNARYDAPAREGGPWVQVSRLGMPLVNEVVIGLPDKDRFNSSEPRNDAANFAKYVFNPTLPTLIEILFGSNNAPAPRVYPRTDLVTVFLDGIPGVNKFGGTPTLGEMVRLNTDDLFVTNIKPRCMTPGIPTSPTTCQNNLGALQCYQGRTATMGPMLVLPPGNMACDVNGFPNGRRPGDDVVDIALQVVMGALYGTDTAPAAGVPLHDAVIQDSSQFDDRFPYLRTPNAGTYP